MRMRRTFFLAIAAALLVAGVASAGRAAYGKGDAAAVLEAFGNGGWAIRNHSPTVMGSPVSFAGTGVAIRPVSGSPYDGAHYCALDWHTIVVANVETGSHQNVAAYLTGYAEALFLDGAIQQTTVTPVKRWLRTSGEEWYYTQTGRTVAPSELAPGAHTLGWLETDSGGAVTGTDEITFYVDASGTGACL
jgi:hypothetical protein